MKKYFSLLFVISLFCIANAQSYAKYWVQFKDKANSKYSIERPSEFLSPAAIALREKNNIAIDELDLPVNDNYIKEVMALDHNMRLFTRSKWLNGITVYSEDSTILQKILQLPCVAFAEKTVTMKEPETVCQTPYTYFANGKTRHSMLQDRANTGDYAYGYAKGQIRLNNGHWLHRLGFNGKDVTMMVMDGGFHNVDSLIVFYILRNDNRLLGVYNFVQPEDDPMRNHSHGTMVLSCISAYSPGFMVGTAPMANIYLCKTEDARSENKVEEDNWVAGIELADSLGCQVLNASLGYTTYDDSTVVRNYDILTGKIGRSSLAATIAVSKGMIVCNSAGNSGTQPWRYISTPADAFDILTVGAVDPEGKHADFSSHGPAADGRVKPDVCAVGLGCVAAVPEANRLREVAGTSFSSPILSGMMACLRQAFPDKSNVEIMDAVRKSASQYNNPDTLLGYGVPDMLRAFNMLFQPEEQGVQVYFPTFLVKKNKLTFNISVTDSNIDQTKMFASVKELDGKKMKCNIQSKALGAGEYEITLNFSSVAKKQIYRVYVLRLEVDGHVMKYAIGQDNEKSK